MHQICVRLFSKPAEKKIMERGGDLGTLGRLRPLQRTCARGLGSIIFFKFYIQMYILTLN